jgi:hypothetical protein
MDGAEPMNFPTLMSDDEIEASLTKAVEIERSGCKKFPTEKERYENAMCLVFDQFGRIYDRIELMWGTIECSDYLRSLISVDTTRVSRQGFPPAVFAALLFLSNYHDKLYHFERPGDNEKWRIP